MSFRDKFKFSKVKPIKFDECEFYGRFKSYALKGIDFVFSHRGRLVLMEVKSRQKLERLNSTVAQFLHTLLLLAPVWLRLPEIDEELPKLVGHHARAKDIVLCITDNLSRDRIDILQKHLERVLKRASFEKMFNCRVQVVDINGLNEIYSPAVTAEKV